MVKKITLKLTLWLAGIMILSCSKNLDLVTTDIKTGAYRFGTINELQMGTIPDSVNSIITMGYYTDGDGGGAQYYRVAVFTDSLPGDRISNGGTVRWRLAKTNGISIRAFGARVDSTTDDAAAANDALLYAAQTGTPLLQPAGTMLVGAELVFPSGAKWVGTGRERTFVRKTISHPGRMLITKDFDMQSGSTITDESVLCKDVYISDITFDGTWMAGDKESYLNDNGGGGLFLYTAKSCYLVNVKVQNMCGIGIFTDAPGSSALDGIGGGRSGKLDNVYIETTKEEGLIYKGISDRFDHNIIQWDAGARINAESTDPVNYGPRSSPTYGSTNGGRTDGVVLLKGMERAIIHSFGNTSGLGIRILDGRYNDCFFMAETCRYGGLSVNGGYGDQVTFQAFRTGGGGIGVDDATPLVYYNAAGVGNVNYGNSYISAYHVNTADKSPRPCVVFGPQARGFVGQVKTRGDNVPGHGIVIDGAATFLDLKIDVRGHLGNSGEVDANNNPILSSGVYRKATSSSRTISIRGKVQNSAVGFRSSGTPRQERVEMEMWLQAGQLPFAGDSATLAGQVWDITADVNGVTTNIRH